MFTRVDRGNSCTSFQEHKNVTDNLKIILYNLDESVFFLDKKPWKTTEITFLHLAVCNKHAPHSSPFPRIPSLTPTFPPFTQSKFSLSAKLFSDADPGSVAVEMGREAAGSPVLRNQASLDMESHPLKKNKTLCQASVSPFCQA